MCQKVQELKNELNLLITFKNNYSPEEYRILRGLWRRKWIDLALSLDDGPTEDNDPDVFTISLN